MLTLSDAAMALSAADVQGMIDRSIATSEAKTEERVVIHVREKIEEQQQTLGTLLASAQTALAELDAKSSVLAQHVTSADARVSSMLAAINNMDDTQKNIAEYMANL